MNAFTISLLLSTIPTLVAASTHPTLLSRQSSIPPAGYYNPSDTGGSMITTIPGPYTVGVGEPVNAILSANSDGAVLVDQATNGGLRNYFLSFGYSNECLGQHSGTDQAVDLGDGNGQKNETAVIRWDYGDPTLGTCTETVQGGSHFRYWVQNGPKRNSGAVFMAFSYEMNISQQHNIVFNGYNLGRDWAVGNVTNLSSIINTSTVSNRSSYSGKTSFGGYTYSTTVKYVSGLLQNTSTNINHGSTVGGNGTQAVDGLVAVWEAKIVQRPSTSSSLRMSSSWTWHLILLISALVASFS